MRYISTSIMVLLLLLAGCVPSLHKLYFDENLTQSPILEGKWAKQDGSQIWDFQSMPDSSYALLFTQKDTPRHFEAHLLLLDGQLFMDTYPTEDIANELYELHMVPAHVFGRVWIDGDTLRLNHLDGDWLEKQIENGQVSIAHEKIDNAIVLTASTADLQIFAKKFMNDTDAWGTKEILFRQK